MAKIFEGLERPCPRRIPWVPLPRVPRPMGSKGLQGHDGTYACTNAITYPPPPFTALLPSSVLMAGCLLIPAWAHLARKPPRYDSFRLCANPAIDS